MLISAVHRWAVPVCAALAPLLIAPGLLFYFDITPKVAVILLAAAAAVLVVRSPPRWVVVLDSRG